MADSIDLTLPATTPADPPPSPAAPAAGPAPTGPAASTAEDAAPAAQVALSVPPADAGEDEDAAPAIDVVDTAADEDSDAPAPDAGDAAASDLPPALTSSLDYALCRDCTYKPCSVEHFVAAGHKAEDFDDFVEHCEERHKAELARRAAEAAGEAQTHRTTPTRGTVHAPATAPAEGAKTEKPRDIPEGHVFIKVTHGSVVVDGEVWLGGTKPFGGAHHKGAVLAVTPEDAATLVKSGVAKVLGA